MKTVYINNFNILDYFDAFEERIPIQISEEEFNKIKNMPFDKVWQWNPDSQIFELVENPDVDILRIKRDYECFSYINRGQLWVNTLTKEQRQELTQWYQAWLDVTETLEIPKKPEWLH